MSYVPPEEQVDAPSFSSSGVPWLWGSTSGLTVNFGSPIAGGQYPADSGAPDGYPDDLEVPPGTYPAGTTFTLSSGNSVITYFGYVMNVIEGEEPEEFPDRDSNYKRTRMRSGGSPNASPIIELSFPHVNNARSYGIYVNEELIDTIAGVDNLKEVWDGEDWIRDHFIEVTVEGAGPFDYEIRAINNIGTSSLFDTVSLSDLNYLDYKYTTNELDGNGAGQSGIAGETAWSEADDGSGYTNPDIILVDAVPAVLFEHRAIFTVPRADAAVKADPGFQQIIGSAYTGSTVDVDLILEDKSKDELWWIPYEVLGYPLQEKAITEGLDEKTRIVSLGKDGSLTLQKGDLESVIITDNNGSIKVSDTNKGTLKITEESIQPNFYLGEQI